MLQGQLDIYWFKNMEIFWECFWLFSHVLILFYFCVLCVCLCTYPRVHIYICYTALMWAWKNSFRGSFLVCAPSRLNSGPQESQQSPVKYYPKWHMLMSSIHNEHAGKNSQEILVSTIQQNMKDNLRSENVIDLRTVKVILHKQTNK